jgi:peptidoglycan L-alanyl-D-glutamate endopeptidase CwlK
MSFILSQKSLRRLEGVHPDLVKVVKRAIQITPIDFIVVEGLRTKERQAYLVEKGASKTMNSRHLTGHAVDLAPIVDNKVSWDWKHFYPLAEAVKKAAEEVKVKVEWGGDWKSFKDGPHWQLPRD